MVEGNNFINTFFAYVIIKLNFEKFIMKMRIFL